MTATNRVVLTLLATIVCLLAPLGTALTMGAEKPPVIRFAYQDRIGSVLPILAVRKGFFSAEGVTIEPLRFSSGPACAEALYSGAADIGGMGDTTAVIMTARSPKFVIIASHATGEHRHRIMVRQDSKIQSLADLKGKRLGVKKGTSTYGGLLAALEKADIAPAEIDIIDLTPPTMTEALLAGSLDAFAASEPTPSTAERKGARELATLGGLGNAYPILILADRNWLDRRSEDVRAFLRALKAAERYAAEHPEETADIMAAETGLDSATTRRAMQRHEYRLRLDEDVLSSLEQTAGFLKSQQIIGNTPDFKVAAAPRFLP